MATWRNTNGAAAAIEAAIERKKEDQAKADDQLKSGDAIELPPPPEHSIQSKPHKKKRKPAGEWKEEIPPAIDGEILEPIPEEKIEEKAYYPQVNLPGPPLVFPIDTSHKVFELSRYGLKPHILCKHIDNPLTGKPLSVELLMQYFGEEVRKGARTGAEETAQSLHYQITGAGGIKRNAAVAIFRSKQDEYIGFTETTQVVHSTAEAEELKKRIEQLDDNDILALRSILAKKVETRIVPKRRVTKQFNNEEEDE